MQLKIDRLDNFGRGIAHINNKIIFIENALPEEIVEIEIIKENTKYIEAKAKKIIKESIDRIEPSCQYYNKCGGCNLRHMSYEAENKYKQNKIENILKHIGGIELKINPIIIGPEDNYRNKVTLHKRKDKIGYYEKSTKNIVGIKSCKLLDNIINENIKSSINSDEIIIRVSNDSKNIIINDNNTIISTIGNKKYEISQNSFFQVNKYLTKKLYDLVRNYIKKRYKTCLDLYCGTGTIGIYISDLVNNVIGIDNKKSNINDALKNKELNHISNIEFICDKVENKIDNFKNIELVIVDPPRAGLDKKTIKSLKTISPELIIYVSCDPITLARDIKELKENFNIKEVTPINMFPRTYHCESIVVLERK